jgi:hypothetical protein
MAAIYKKESFATTKDSSVKRFKAVNQDFEGAGEYLTTLFFCGSTVRRYW